MTKEKVVNEIAHQIKRFEKQAQEWTAENFYYQSIYTLQANLLKETLIWVQAIDSLKEDK